MTPFQERLGRVGVQCMTGLNNLVYRLSAGRIAGHVPSGAPICLLTTVGRTTGRRRTVPLLYLPTDEGLAVVASKGGMSTYPAWYLNLRHEPRVVVQTGADIRPAVARLATDDERELIWPRLLAVYEHFDAYQMRTTRPIPLVILCPISP
jgi:deazaflavin-dependent oxidoreductase (nitroreductase family)